MSLHTNLFSDPYFCSYWVKEPEVSAHTWRLFPSSGQSLTSTWAPVVSLRNVGKKGIFCFLSNVQEFVVVVVVPPKKGKIKFKRKKERAIKHVVHGLLLFFSFKHSMAWKKTHIILLSLTTGLLLSLFCVLFLRSWTLLQRLFLRFAWGLLQSTPPPKSSSQNRCRLPPSTGPIRYYRWASRCHLQ